MKRQWLVIPFAIAAVAVLWTLRGGNVDTMNPVTLAGYVRSEALPVAKIIPPPTVCPSTAYWNVVRSDCIPEHVARPFTATEERRSPK